MEQIDILRHAVEALERMQVPYVIVGSIASIGGGDRHLRDIAGILRVTGDSVDRAEVERWAARLGYLGIWQQIVAKVDAPDSPPAPGNP